MKVSPSSQKPRINNLPKSDPFSKALDSHFNKLQKKQSQIFLSERVTPRSLLSQNDRRKQLKPISLKQTPKKQPAIIQHPDSLITSRRHHSSQQQLSANAQVSVTSRGLTPQMRKQGSQIANKFRTSRSSLRDIHQQNNSCIVEGDQQSVTDTQSLLSVRTKQNSQQLIPQQVMKNPVTFSRSLLRKLQQKGDQTQRDDPHMVRIGRMLTESQQQHPHYCGNQSIAHQYTNKDSRIHFESMNNGGYNFSSMQIHPQHSEPLAAQAVSPQIRDFATTKQVEDLQKEIQRLKQVMVQQQQLKLKNIAPHPVFVEPTKIMNRSNGFQIRRSQSAQRVSPLNSYRMQQQETNRSQQQLENLESNGYMSIVKGSISSPMSIPLDIMVSARSASAQGNITQRSNGGIRSARPGSSGRYNPRVNLKIPNNPASAFFTNINTQIKRLRKRPERPTSQEVHNFGESGGTGGQEIETCRNTRPSSAIFGSQDDSFESNCHQFLSSRQPIRPKSNIFANRRPMLISHKLPKEFQIEEQTVAIVDSRSFENIKLPDSNIFNSENQEFIPDLYDQLKHGDLPIQEQTANFKPLFVPVQKENIPKKVVSEYTDRHLVPSREPKQTPSFKNHPVVLFPPTESSLSEFSFAQQPSIQQSPQQDEVAQEIKVKKKRLVIGSGMKQALKDLHERINNNRR